MASWKRQYLVLRSECSWPEGQEREWCEKIKALAVEKFKMFSVETKESSLVEADMLRDIAY